MRTASIPARLAAALGLLAALSQPVLAFSQIGTRDGAAPQREGIVSVPLPPLAGTASPAPTEAETRPAPPAAGTQPTSPQLPATGASPVETPDDTTPSIEAPANEQPSDDAPPSEPETTPDEAAPPQSGIPAGAVSGEAEGPPPTVVYGEEGLPKPVRDLREKLIAIAKAGDVEALRPYIELGEEGTLLSFGGAEGDPIAFLKSASGDGEGVEILAILLEVLEAGHTRNEPDSDNEIFVWPYFTALAIDKLTQPQKVELFELVTAGDYQEMIGFGAYNFYRAGISPDGKLQFFVAGD